MLYPRVFSVGVWLAAALCLLLVASPLPAAAAAAGAPAKLYLLDPATGARCLDGTPSGFYLQPALSARGNTTWVIHLEGGGECASEESCKARTKNAQGSSNYFSPTRNLGMLNSQDQHANPDLWDANHILLPYCVGDLWSGTVTAAGPNTWGLYFAGHLTVVAAVHELQQHFGMQNAPSTRIVLTGDSAGGIGTWINADHIQESLLPYAQLHIAAFAGFYSTSVPYAGPGATSSILPNFTADGLAYNAGLWSSFVDVSCAKALRAAGQDPSLCLLSNNSFPYISVPSFAFESLSDQVVLTAHDSVPNPPLLCSAPVQEYLAQWRANMAAALAPLANPQDRRHGVFAPACWTHVFLAGPVINGVTAMQAYSNWINQRTGPSQFQIIDQCDGNFCNPSCANPCAKKQGVMAME